MIMTLKMLVIVNIADILCDFGFWEGMMDVTKRK